MTSPNQQLPDTPPLAPEPQLSVEPNQVQAVDHSHNEPLEDKQISKQYQNCQVAETNDKVQENQTQTHGQAVQNSEEKTEENASAVLEIEQTNPVKQVKFSQDFAQKSQHSIELNFQCQVNPNNPAEQFQVHIHQVESKQSLSQNGEQRYQINFTKSQINIPIQYQGGQDQDQQINQIKLQQLQSANCSIRPSEDDDFYVQYLQQKWAKRQQQQNQMNQLISNLEKDYQKSQTVPNSVARSKQTNQYLKTTPQKIQKSNSIQNNKKTQFKVKKLQDKSTSSTTNVRSLLNTTNQLKSFKSTQNRSELLDTKTNELKPYKYSRVGKKHLSNFQASPNKSPSKQSIYKNQINTNVHYEISLGNAIQMMSQILQDRCYNTAGTHKKVTSNLPQNSQPKPQIPNKVRKIIKRSPYGILQIEVKENNKNNAKITNLRILKPKEMIRLKKIPNLVKGNKENVGQKSIVRLQQKSMSQKQGSLGQGGLPLLNCNRK